MPAPIGPRSEIDATSPPSAPGDADETYTLSVADSGEALPAFGSPAEPGEVGTLGPYRLLKELGRGGMGAVYAALDTRLERRLAMKVMLPKFAADTSSRERFLREARAAARIKHDNVVTVYEADEREGVPYIAMEFLEGYPLDRYLAKKGNPSIPQVLRIGAEAASGLAAAHKLGLVHRDIKPGNLWLEAPNGRVKVLDFGLAKPMDAEVEITRSGAVVGTPAYMSPEQARGNKVDHRSDLFSLGGLLYRLCTGKLPFQGSTTMAVLMALGTEEPPPARSLNPDVPEALAELIHQLLTKSADARPQSATEVVKRLRGIASELAAPRALPVEESPSQPQVLYVPMQVTALPQHNPFADLDSPETELASREFAEPTPVPQQARQTPGGGSRRKLLAVGFGALAALVLGGVIIIIKNRDGTETKIEVPDGATVSVKDKGGRTLVQVKPDGGKSALDSDRKAAEYVLSLKGTVRVNGENSDIKAAAELPMDHFALTNVNLDNNKSVTDAGLAHFKDCKSLIELRLNDTAVTDAGFSHFKDCKSLEFLGLIGTKVSDAGLANFKDCKALKEIALNSPVVTDAGLAHFKDCKGLRSLILGETAITDTGLAYFKESKGLLVLNAFNTAVTDAGLVHAKGWTRLEHISLANTKVTDAGLAHFKECNGLVLVDMRSTRTTDAALAHFKNCKGLVILNLDNTAVSDAGLAHVKGWKGLRDLSLRSTKVTDAVLDHLKECTGLALLHLQMTKVTVKGLEEFHAAVPGCKIEHDGGTIEPKVVADPDRKAAECALSIGGTVRVNDEASEIKAAADLPKDRFTLTRVDLVGNGKVTDAWLAHFKDCTGLTVLNLTGTAVTDTGLAHFKDCTGLRQILLHDTTVTDAGLVHFKNCTGLTILGLHSTGVTDAGLDHFKSCKELIYLDLSGTKLTDAGLGRFKHCKALTKLDVRKTKLTAKALEEFHAAVPGCKIEHDGGAIEPKK